MMGRGFVVLNLLCITYMDLLELLCFLGVEIKRINMSECDKLFNVTWANLFTVAQRNRPISIAFYDAHWGTEDLFSSDTPGSPDGGGGDR